MQSYTFFSYVVLFLSFFFHIICSTCRKPLIFNEMQIVKKYSHFGLCYKYCHVGVFFGKIL